jgi:hypothetical protein
MRNSNATRAWAALVLLVSWMVPYSASARPEFLELFLEQYPAVVGTRLESCNVCHTDPPRRNLYGTDFSVAGRDFVAIEPFDSDGDGFSNLTEITALTFPGNPLDFPGAEPSATATPTPTQTPVLTPTIALDACYGDCNDDGFVTVNELVLGVNVALRISPLAECPSLDRTDEGEVSIDEVVLAVSLALGGCPDL